MAGFDIGAVLKLIPEDKVAAFIDTVIDTELAKVAAELKVLAKQALDKAYGTTIAAQPPAAPLTTSVQG